MKKLLLLSFIAIFFCLNLSSLSAKEKTKTCTGKNPEKESVINSVKKAVEFFKENGFDVLCAEINNPKSDLNKPNYMFLYNLNRICIAIGNHQDRIGKNFSKEKDKKGCPFVKKFTEKAKKNKPGWISYYWPEKNSKKHSYVVRIQDPKTNKIYALGSGYIEKPKSCKLPKRKSKTN